MNPSRRVFTHFSWVSTLGAVLGDRLRRRARWLTGMTVVEAALDLASIGSVIPLLALAANPDAQIARVVTARLAGLFGPLTSTQAMGIVAAAVATMLTLRGILKLVSASQRSRFTADVRVHVTQELITFYSREPYEHQLRADPNRRLTLIGADAANVASLATDSIAVIGSTMTVLAMAAMMFAVDWRVASFAVLIGGGSSALSYFLLSRRLRELGHDVKEARFQMTMLASRLLHGLNETAIYDRDETVRSVFFTEAQRMGRSFQKSSLLRRLPEIIAEWVLGIAVVGGIWGLAVHADFAAALPLAVAFAVATLRLGPAAMSAITNAAQLRFQLGSLYEVHKDVCKLPDTIKARARATGQPLHFRNDIAFSDVSFSYPRSKTSALRDIDLVISQGSLVGVCGTSGSGKSTFINLLMGMLLPTRGEVRIDGVVMSGREGDWRELIALVPQEPFFWNASVRENLLFGRDIADADARLWEALETAHIAKFVRSLPEGLNTRLGDRGRRVSGGQRQRLAIARALLGDPQLLVLDEPTSALDQEIAHAIDDALADLKGRKTIVLVAHRAVSVARCDQVIYFEAGRVAGVGSFDALASTMPAFGKTLGLTKASQTSADRRADRPHEMHPR